MRTSFALDMGTKPRYLAGRGQVQSWRTSSALSRSERKSLGGCSTFGADPRTLILTTMVLRFMVNFSIGFGRLCESYHLLLLCPLLPRPFKARKKKKRDSPPTILSDELSKPDKNAGLDKYRGITQRPAFVSVTFFWPARKNTSQWVILPLVLMIAGLFPWCAGLWV